MKYLNISWNHLTAINRDTFRGLASLIELNLGFNSLTELSSHVFLELHSLEILRLPGNQLAHLEEGLFKSTKFLTELYLEENQFLEVPGPALTNLHSLKLLSLSENLIISIHERNLPTLTELSDLLLDRNVINNVEPGSLSRLVSLSHLDLSDNNFTSIPTSSLAKLSNLTYFRFSGNFIETLPAVAFRGLFHLKTLILEKLELLNQIDPRAFVDNINLETVKLDDNIALEMIPARLFHGNRKLTHVSIRNNMLTTLDASHFPIDQLHSLKLGGNPWECNCTLLWLWKLTREQLGKNQIQKQNESETKNLDEPIDLRLDLDSISCNGPEPVKGILLVKVKEATVSCSLNWIATVSAVSFACILLALATSLIYCGILKNKRKRLPKDPTPCCSRSVTLAFPYDDSLKRSPHASHDYQTLSPWTPVQNPHDIYSHFGSNNMRPHVVYV